MFGNLGVHLMQFPTGKWGFRGTLPIVLADEAREATMSDVMGQRAFRDNEGTLRVWHFPVFVSEVLAREYARDKGVTLAN